VEPDIVLKVEMRHSLFWRITLPFVIWALVATLGIILFTRYFYENQYLEQQRRHALSEAYVLSKRVAPILAGEGSTPDALSQILLESIHLMDGWIGVFDSHDLLLAQATSENWREEFSPEFSQIALGSPEATITRLSNGERVVVARVAIFDQSGRNLGWLSLIQSLKDAERSLGQLGAFLWIAGALGIALVTITALGVGQYILHPLRQLTAIIASSEATEESLEPIRKRKDEIGRLAQAFALLANQLRSQIEALSTERIQFAAVLQYMTDGIIIVDPEGRVRLINPAAERLFGTSSDACLGGSLIEVVRHHQLVELWRRALQNNRQYTTTFEMTPSRAFIQAIATPLGEVLQGNVLLVVQDLTRVRRLETVRRDFISNVSHELRTPLASLKALTETLEEGALEDPPAARRFLQQMDREIDNMTQLVRELLELSRIESGKVPLNRQPLQAADLLESAAARMHLQAERAGLNLSVRIDEPLPPVLADRERIEQVLINLLHNAIKFTPPGGYIELAARVEGNEVIFSVKDTGVGIDPEALPRIFERFYKADQSRSGGGTGLGLSIARHTVEAHGGRIWAESVLNRGSTFFFTLPVVQSEID